MQNVNNDGLFDKYELIDSCIVTLSNLRIPVKDIGEVAVAVVDVIKRLSALKKGLKDEEKGD